MLNLPLHKSSQFSEFGLQLRRINSPTNNLLPVAYAHQDDYYIFGLVVGGTGTGIIDFKEQHFSSGDVFLIQPGQVHRFVSAEDADGWLLMIDSSFVGSKEKCVFDNFSLIASSSQIDERRRNELLQIALLLADRLDCIADKDTVTTARHMAETIVSIVAEVFSQINVQRMKFSHRHIEIVLKLRRLLAEHLTMSRRPSYYASLLNISTVYLNEVVKEVTGMNTTLYIRNAVVLQAKRLLVHSDFAVNEIADRLGIDDYAYFSRLFTRTAGISPILFRQRNRE